MGSGPFCAGCTFWGGIFYSILLFFAPRFDPKKDTSVAQTGTSGVLAQLVPSLATCAVQKNRWSPLKDVPYYHFAPTSDPPPTAPESRPTCTPVALPKRL